jgi:hypothetical protein
LSGGVPVVSTKERSMSIDLKCYANCDDVFLVWSSKTRGEIAPIDDCMGFQIEVRNEGQPDKPVEVLQKI